MCAFSWAQSTEQVLTYGGATEPSRRAARANGSERPCCFLPLGATDRVGECYRITNVCSAIVTSMEISVSVNAVQLSQG